MKPFSFACFNVTAVIWAYNKGHAVKLMAEWLDKEGLSALLSQGLMQELKPLNKKGSVQTLWTTS